MQRIFFTAVVHKEPDRAFGVSFPDLPGCITAGDTIEEAVQQAAEAAAFHIEGLIEDGAAVPEATPADRIEPDPTAFGLVLVPVRLPGKTVRANITIDEHLLAYIDSAASAEGLSRFAFLAEAARERLAKAG